MDEAEAERRPSLRFVSSLSFSLASRRRDEERVGEETVEAGDARGEAELSETGEETEASEGDLREGGEPAGSSCGEAAVWDEGVPGPEPGVKELRTEKADGRLDGCADEDWEDSRKAEGEAAGSEAEEREEAAKEGEATDSTDGAAADETLDECSGETLGGDDEGDAVLAMDACLR